MKRNETIVIVLIAVIIGCGVGRAQPVERSKRVIEGVEVYQDFKNSNLFYYAPGNLSLAYEADGKPRFQLLEMRYTGSSAYGDSGEKRFMNVVQFTILMEQTGVSVLKAVKKQLGAGSIDLRPLPVREVEAFLVAPVSGAKEAYKKIGKDGSFQSEGKGGTSDKNGFWTERTFTVKLENHEAQLLWDQVATGKLALSLGYAFYADIIPGRKGDMNVTGDRKLAEEFEKSSEDLLTTDTLAVTHLVKADAFPIRVDTEKWPDVLKKIDINEGVPPAYAALEVRCYDFTDDLRPDLAIKAIDIEATGVGGRPVLLPAKKFLSNEPDLNAIQIRFPYAVKLTEPFRYRITEYNKEGEKKVSAWITKQTWGSLDVTTVEADRKIEKKSIDVEVDDLKKGDVSEARLYFFYSFREKVQQLQVLFNADNTLPVQVANLRYDKGNAIHYKVVWKYGNGEIYESKLKEVPLIDDYIFLSIPDKKTGE